MVRFFLFSVFACAIVMVGCDKSSKTVAHYTDLSQIPAERWDELSKQRIFFGHQSVGYNILEGVQDVQKDHPEIKLAIEEVAEGAPIDKPQWAHAKVGQNRDPGLKMQAFDKRIRSNPKPLDIAFLKLCYVDIMADTDVETLFQTYRQVFTALERDYPETRFVHLTTPLFEKQSGPKAWVKKIIGRPLYGVDDNIKRFEYNQMLREAYGSTNRLFDLATIESTRPDGTRSSFEKDGKTYYSLVPEYTYDGGHLNETGRRAVAERLLLFLSNLD